MGIFGRVYGAIFGAIFGSIGGTTPVDTEEPGLAATALAAINRLAEQFKSKVKITDLMAAISEPAQPVEDALQQLLTERGVYDAIGVQLDRLGSIVGQPRDGFGDEDYRRFLLTRVAINKSRGRITDLIRVARLALGDDPTAIRVQSEQVATAVVEVLGYVPGQDLANILFGFLDQARAAGVRLLLQTLTALEDNSFTCAPAAFLDGAQLAGVTELAVGSTADFPTSGTLDLDTGTAEAEQVTYDGKLADRFLNVSATTQDHDDGACALLADDGDTGFAVVAYVDSGAANIGNTTLSVDTTEGFASSGSLELFAVDDDPEEDPPVEVVTYSGKTAFTFTGVSPLTSDYDENALVRPTAGTRGGHLATAQDQVL